MQYEATYTLLTSLFNPAVVIIELERHLAVTPITLQQTKRFEVSTPESALETAQYIGYHTARIINPHVRDGWSECILTKLTENGESKEMQLPKLGSHFADSTFRKYLRLNGEDHFVEIVGINSVLFLPYDWLTNDGKVENIEKTNLELENMTDEQCEQHHARHNSPETNLFYDKYVALMSAKREDIDLWPTNRGIVMLPYVEKKSLW